MFVSKENDSICKHTIRRRWVHFDHAALDLACNKGHRSVYKLRPSLLTVMALRLIDYGFSMADRENEAKLCWGILSIERGCNTNLTI